MARASPHSIKPEALWITCGVEISELEWSPALSFQAEGRLRPSKQEVNSYSPTGLSWQPLRHREPPHGAKAILAGRTVLPGSSDPTPETKIANATLQILEKQTGNNLDGIQRKTGMAPNADFNGESQRLLRDWTQEGGTPIPKGVKSAETGLRETRGTQRSHCPDSNSSQVHVPEMSLSGVSSDLSNDFEKEAEREGNVFAENPNPFMM